METAQEITAANQNLIRGTIKVDVSTSEPVITAASEFSIFVIIRNPYNVAITVYSAQTHIPIALIDTIWEKEFADYLAKDRKRRFESASSRFDRLRLGLLFGWQDVIRRLRPPTGRRIAEAVSTEVGALKTATARATSISLGNIEESSKIVVGDYSELWDLNFFTMPSKEDLDRIFRRIEDYRQGKVPVVLQPGNALVKQFILRARESLFFSPIEFTFQIQVKYDVDKMEQLEVIPFRASIRAAIGSMIVGSIAGGILGALAQTIGKGQTIVIGSLALPAILSAVAVVAFARKTNAQQIVSVEDFWGGFFVGFLVGYLGESFFRTLLGY